MTDEKGKPSHATFAIASYRAIMFRIIPKLAVRALGRPSYPKCVPWRLLHSSALRYQQQIDPQQQKEMMDTMKQKYEDKHPEEVESIKKEVEEMCQRVQSKIDETYYICVEQRASFPLPSDQGDEVKPAQRYQTIYRYMLNEFVNQCSMSQQLGHNRPPPDKLIEEISETFSALHSDVEPITSHDILPYFHLYWALSHDILKPADLGFQSPPVEEVWKLHQQGKSAAETTEQTKLDAKVVESWYEVFKTLAETPKATKDQPLVCLLCPVEFSKILACLEEIYGLQQRLSDLEKEVVETPAEGDLERLFYLVGVHERFDAMIPQLGANDIKVDESK